MDPHVKAPACHKYYVKRSRTHTSQGMAHLPAHVRMGGQLFERGQFTGQRRRRARHPIFHTNPWQENQTTNEPCIIIRFKGLKGLTGLDQEMREAWVSLWWEVFAFDWDMHPFLWRQTTDFISEWLHRHGPLTHQLIEERIINDSHDRGTLVGKTNWCSHHGESMDLYLLATIYCTRMIGLQSWLCHQWDWKRVRNYVSDIIFPPGIIQHNLLDYVVIDLLISLFSSMKMQATFTHQSKWVHRWFVDLHMIPLRCYATMLMGKWTYSDRSPHWTITPTINTYNLWEGYASLIFSTMNFSTALSTSVTSCMPSVRRRPDNTYLWQELLTSTLLSFSSSWALSEAKRFSWPSRIIWPAYMYTVVSKCIGHSTPERSCT